MRDIFAMSETEEKIMQLFWKTGKEMGLREVLTYFNENENKKWAKQTLYTFLTRLLDKGILSATGKGRKKYSPAMTQVEYEQKKAKSILDGIYDGEISHFVAALTGGQSLNKAEADELRELLDK